MRTIRQISLDLSRKHNRMLLPEGFVCVKSEFNLARRQLELWVEVPLRPDVPEVEYVVRAVENGQPVPMHYRYISTAFHPYESRAVHLYEVSEPRDIGVPLGLTQAA
jgi:hypothetical protein